MASILEGSDSFTGINWWIGQVAPRETWTENTLMKNDKDVGASDRKGDNNVYPNRVKVRVVGYHDKIEDPNELPFASVVGNPFISSGYGSAPNLHQLEGGESVLGVWIDGDDEQKPVITNVFLKSQTGADGKTTDLKSNTYVRPHRRKRGSGVKTGNPQGEKLGTNETIAEEKYEKTDGEYNSETGRSEKIVDADLSGVMSGAASPTTQDDINAEARLHQIQDQKTDRPTCKRDNSIGEITGALGDLSKLLIKAEKYGDFYYNAVTGLQMDFDSEMALITKKIGGIMSAKVNGIRDTIFSGVEEKVNDFTNKLIPEDLKTQFAEGVRGVMGTMYCLFENLIFGLKDTIGNFLKSLIGKLLNAPLCAAEQILGGLLENIMSKITGLIGPILSGLTATLGGALGSVNGLINKAMAGIGLLYDFIGCQEFKCPLPSRFDNKLGPEQMGRDDFKNPLAFMSNISNAIGGGDNPENLPSMFKKTEGDPSTVAALVGECETNVLRCGPPSIELFGGSGVGGFANAVVNNIGQIIGVNILDPGMGYTPENPPYVTFKDACGDGNAATGTAIIGEDGGIDNILIESPGYGYNNTYTKTLTTSGPVESDVVSELANADSESVVGQIDDVKIIDPGSGYNTTDTLEVDGAELTPIILGGKIVGVNVANGGAGFTSIPEITVNSDTGIGANLRSILKFVSVTEVSQKLDSTQIIEVIDCIDKPLSRRRIGS